ncbi:MAG: TonB-dependent receptor [Steroidobacteraceae bacterium]|nr:TonB-dependent receptor [Steroidobacteraceae bacterium]
MSGRRLTTALPLAPLLLAGVPMAHAQDAEQSALLEEVVVTAQKQTENLQAVPMSIQAFGETKLEELRINNMSDYMKFMPSVSVQSYGPGFTRVFMRGVASGDNGNHSGPMPSVGQYLDEQPITTIVGALDIHIYDIERVEMLAGPQGTLYGASSQSGTIRTITNKPDTSAFSASYDLQGSYVSEGDSGYTAEGYVNIPISDTAAVRLVGWYVHSPGYIDNVKGEMTFPTSGITMTNHEPGHNFAKNNYNDGDTYGARALLKIDLNDNWSITPGVIGQVANINGLFAYDPAIGDLKVSHFFKEETKDSWVQASLTVEGKIGNWEMVYAGAYLDRNQHERNDYSDYAYWYDVCCGYGSSMVNDDGDLINPAQYIKGKDGFKMWSNELRFSSPRDNRLRFTGGLFAQSDEHRIEQRYMVDDLATDYWVTGWKDTIWLTEQTRTDDSYAAFGELYYDITDKLTATAGIRLFHTNNDLKGFFGFSQGFNPGGTGESQCFPSPGYYVDPDDPDSAYVPSDPATWNSYYGAPCVNLNKSTSESGSTPKFNLAYKFDEDRMVYLTYSEGFRPGGVNRRGTFPPYKSDYLTNYEAGWKTTWADGRVRFNGAAFVQEWDKFQYSFLGENGLTNVRNAGQAQISGIETYVDWAATDQWRFSAGATWLDPKLTQNFCQAIDEDPCEPENLAKKGTRLPVTPTFKGNLIARYTFKIGEYDGDLQGSYVYQNDVEAELLPYNRQFTGKQDAYGVADFSGTLRRGPYSLTLYIDNAFDERADLFKYQECAVEVCGSAGNPYWNDPPAYPGYSIPHPYTTYTGPNQPRTIGLIFRQEF